MLNHEERLKSFLDAINREAQENYDKVLSEIEEQSKIELSKAKTVAEKQAQDYVNKYVAKCKNEANNKIANEMSKIRMELSKLREKTTVDVFSDAKSKLTAFTDSDKYKSFLENSAASLFDLLGEGAQIFVRSKDAVFADMITEKFGGKCTVTEDNDIKIGGLKAKKADGTLIADDTLDTRLKQQYEWFLSHCNLSVELH